MMVNPDILEWARETAGLSPSGAAEVLGFTDSRKRSAVERLTALEGGKDEPSRSVLLKMAKAYRRSLLVFYLQEPPRKGDRGQDFRTVPGAEPPLYNPLLDALIRDIRGRQGIVRDLLEEEDTEPLDFVGSASANTPEMQLVKEIPERLEFSLQEFRRQSSTERAFAYLREKLEASGVFVVLLGNLGSHHTNIEVETFRGFVIADPIAPFIVVNDQDAKAAWSFTALHEAAHLWLGNTGVSSTSTDARIEKYCNDIAGEILLPESEIQEFAHLEGAGLEEAVEEISLFARPRNLSRSMVSYKLFRSGVIGATNWKALAKHFKQEWLANKQRKSYENEGEGGPSYYVVKRHRLGPALVGIVGRSLAEGVISYTKASRVLGVKPRNIQPLLHGSSARGRR